MRIEMRQGVVSHQSGGFLQLTVGGDINIIAGNRPVVTTLAHHNTNYIHSENATVIGAWNGPFTTPKTWLYWNFDLATFKRTFGHTDLEPIAQAIKPGGGGTNIQTAITGTNNTGRFVVSGYFVLPQLRTLAVSGSTGNDGLYTVFSSSYDDTVNKTTIFVSEDIVDNTADGLLSLEFDIDGFPLVTEGRMWYDTNNHIHFELMGGVWVEVLRVFAAQLIGGTTFVSHSILGGQNFSGTQIGDTTSILVGRPLFTENSNVIRRDNRTFLTTEDQFFTNQSRVDALRLESNVARAKSAEAAIASFTVVAWLDDGEIGTSQYDHAGTTVVGILTEDVFLSEVGAVIIQGVITNPSWSWTQAPDAVAVGSPLWVANGILVPENPHTTDVSTYPTSRVPVARVLDNTTIIFEQGLGGVGEIGPPGAVETLPSATTIDIGAVTLVTPSSDPLQAFVISDTDPRLANARTPSQHVHPATEVLFTPAGGLISSNAQLALAELGNTKFNLLGGTVSGSLFLASNPTTGLQAATKIYVDGLVSGLVWLDPVRLINMISDTIGTPPVSPQLSDAYIVPPGAVGDWSAIPSGHVVVWDDSTWLDRGSVTTIDPVAARFGIAMQTSTIPSGSFAGRSKHIVNYDATGNIDSFEVPTTNNAVYVNHTSSLHAFDQFAFDGADWILFGGAAPVTADGVTTVLNANLLGVKQFDDGGINDVSHWQGLVPADLATTYSTLSHSHTSVDLANAPYTSSLNWGTLQDPTEAHITSITIQSALNELVDKKAGKQQAYTSLTDAPDASTVSGMTVYVQDESVLYYATGGSWVQLATSDDDVSIPYDITFSITNVLQQDTIVGTYVSGRVVDLAPSLPNSIAHVALPAADGPYVFRILLTPISTGTTSEIGTITFAVGERFGVFDFTSAVVIGALDVLQIATDDANPPDSGLQDVGITIIGCSITALCEPYVLLPITLPTCTDQLGEIFITYADRFDTVVMGGGGLDKIWGTTDTFFQFGGLGILSTLNAPVNDFDFLYLDRDNISASVASGWFLCEDIPSQTYTSIVPNSLIATFVSGNAFDPDKPQGVDIHTVTVIDDVDYRMFVSVYVTNVSGSTLANTRVAASFNSSFAATDNFKGYSAIPANRTIYSINSFDSIISGMYTPDEGYSTATRFDEGDSSLDVHNPKLVFENADIVGANPANTNMALAWDLGSMEAGETKKITYEYFFKDVLSEIFAGRT